MARRKSRLLARILGWTMIVLFAVIFLTADHDPFTWVFAAGAYMAGYWVRSQRRSRRVPSPRRAGPRRAA